MSQLEEPMKEHKAKKLDAGTPETSKPSISDKKTEKVLELHEIKSLDDPEEELILVSQEQSKVSVPKPVAMMSELVKTMAEGGSIASLASQYNSLS